MNYKNPDMLAVKFIIAVIFIIAALVGIAFVIIRAIGNNKRWKALEPEFIRDIEKSVGQKIVCKTMLNANDSTDFSNAKGFWLWVAFTSDYIVFALRDSIARNGEGYAYISKRTDVSMKRLEKKFAEVEFKDAKSSERLKFVVFVRPCDYELLNRFITLRLN